MVLFTRFLLASTAIWGSVSTAKKSDGPEITATSFPQEPINLFYFEDTDTILFQEHSTGIVHRSGNAGKTWDPVGGPGGDMNGKVAGLLPHPYDKKKAYMVGQLDKHWVTEDTGKSWRAFKIDKPLSRKQPFIFHGRDSNKVLVQAEECAQFMCETFSYYTTDGFQKVHPMVEGQRSCTWAISSPLFGEGVELEPGVENRIFCAVPGLHSPLPSDTRFLYSDNYFKDERASEAPLNDGRAVSGVVRTAGVKKFLMAAVSSGRTDELALYVTRDAVRWHRAEFGGRRIEEDAYTVLESTNYSIQIGVLTHPGATPIGELFSSNSNGTYYTQNADHLNIDSHNTVDFEKVAGIQGIFLVNTVKNWEEIENRRETDKKIISKISFDDGRTFSPLKLKKGDKELHLHSVTNSKNSGRVFSSPAPGLVMGVGNTGDHLKEYSEGNLYVSDDAGLTWSEALEGAHKYEFGDQGSVLVAVNDKGQTNKISYSINHGKDWNTLGLPHKIRAKQLTTTPDSTSLKFLLVGTMEDGGKYQLMTIDFSEMRERTCEDKDFDPKWPARLDEKKNPDCLMGHKQFYRRRKADADCFIGNTQFKDPVPEFEPCKCSKEDFECDTNYVRSTDRDRCVPALKMPVPEGECKNSNDEYRGHSGFRIIPGNDCIRDGGVELDKDVMRLCNETMKSPLSGEISVEKSVFNKTEQVRQYLYLERTQGTVGDETIIMLTKSQQVFITKDHGKAWKEVLSGKNISAMIPHLYYNDAVYFVTATTKGYWTVDHGDTFHEFEAKLPPTEHKDISAMSFHPQHRDWLIWMGDDDCDDCVTAYYSTNRGDEWHLLRRNVKKCEFLGMEGRPGSDKLVLCAQYENENPKTKHLQLLSTEDWFEKQTVHFPDIIKFATAAEFVIVAARADDKTSLKVDTSVDGSTYADAQFPPNFHVDVQQAYTVLPAKTHAAFLHVTVNAKPDQEYGSILKSNSNGTSYVLSVHNVNRNREGYVDFERMQVLEGVELVNVVANREETDDGSPKKLKTMITHNDGAEWAYIPPPKKDADDGAFGCSPGKDGKATEKCALHLHAFTERVDWRDMYSSESAIGLMIGTGNVGEHLGDKSDAGTFITRDAGISWQHIRKGNYMWEFGDQGSVIVIVPESKSTKTLLYTLDEGKTWKDFQFSDVDMEIDDISTVPSDSSLNFLLWGKEVGDGAQKGLATINIDFSGLKERERKCDLREDAPEDGDYYLWLPRHPLQNDNCLFGHEARYHRKRIDSQCHNGRDSHHLDHAFRNCECTRQDYEWYAYTFFLLSISFFSSFFSFC